MLVGSHEEKKTRNNGKLPLCIQNRDSEIQIHELIKKQSAGHL